MDGYEDRDARIARVRRMETVMDRVLAGGRDPADIAALRGYFDEWFRHDYEADEQGLFPPEMKRGILSQDALYDLLAELDEEL